MIVFLGNFVLIRPLPGNGLPPISSIPPNALLDDQGQPILDEEGNYIIVNI